MADRDSRTVKDEYKYGYDAAGNRTYRDNTQTTGKDEKYTYDNLDRLTSYDRGTLSSGSITSKVRNEAWMLSQVGNWTVYQIDSDGNGDYDDAGDLDQNREHNAGNEISGIYEGFGDSWLDPVQDKAGNMTAAPRPDDESTGTSALIMTYDAWNRPAEIHHAMGGDANLDGKVDISDMAILGTYYGTMSGMTWGNGDFSGDGAVDVSDNAILGTNYDYDATTDMDALIATYTYDGKHRRIKKTTEGVAYDYYYNTGWRILEIRKDSDTDPYEQYVWGIRYVHSPVCRFRDGNIDGDYEDTGDDTDDNLYFTNDANFNVTALINTDGSVAERYVYDAYGRVTIYNSDWSSEVTWANSRQNIVLYTGHKYDAETGLYYCCRRYYHPTLGRWITTDPKDMNAVSGGYHDGMNLYEYVRSNPVSLVDWEGLEGIKCKDGDVSVWNDKEYKVNGCGSGSTAGIVPDKIGSVDFAWACNNHDACYGDCDREKKWCDLELQSDMRVACNFAFGNLMGGTMSIADSIQLRLVIKSHCCIGLLLRS